jgi:hypothetical protein
MGYQDGNALSMPVPPQVIVTDTLKGYGYASLAFTSIRLAEGFALSESMNTCPAHVVITICEYALNLGHSIARLVLLGTSAKIGDALLNGCND